MPKSTSGETTKAQLAKDSWNRRLRIFQEAFKELPKGGHRRPLQVLVVEDTTRLILPPSPFMVFSVTGFNSVTYPITSLCDTNDQQLDH
jgi:hypothetical protein